MERYVAYSAAASLGDGAMRSVATAVFVVALGPPVFRLLDRCRRRDAGASWDPTALDR